MNNLPRQTLCELIAKYGESLGDEPLKCEGLLRDLCGQYRLEVNVLIDAIKERITADLRGSSESVPIEVTLSRLTKRFQDHRGATQETARWVVESWALALGKISEHDLSKHTASSVSSLQTGAPVFRPQTSAPLKVPSTGEKIPSSRQPQRAVMELGSETASDRQLRKLTWAVVLGFVTLLLGIAIVSYFAFFLPQQRLQRTTAQSATPEPAIQPTAVPTQSPTAQTAIAEDRAKTRQPSGGKELLTLSVGYRVNSVAFSSDGRRIVTGDADGTAKVWDEQTDQELLTLRHSLWVYSVAFSPDGTRIVTGGWDSTAKVWDAQSGRELLTLKGHSDIVTSVAFSPDGKRIVTGSGDKTAKVWDATIEQ